VVCARGIPRPTSDICIYIPLCLWLSSLIANKPIVEQNYAWYCGLSSGFACACATPCTLYLAINEIREFRKTMPQRKGKGGAEPPLPLRLRPSPFMFPALRRQAPRWARGWVGDPTARSRTSPRRPPAAHLRKKVPRLCGQAVGEPGAA
jgi:hypothetical protein